MQSCTASGIEQLSTSVPKITEKQETYRGEDPGTKQATYLLGNTGCDSSCAASCPSIPENNFEISLVRLSAALAGLVRAKREYT